MTTACGVDYTNSIEWKKKKVDTRGMLVMFMLLLNKQNVDGRVRAFFLIVDVDVDVDDAKWISMAMQM